MNKQALFVKWISDSPLGLILFVYVFITGVLILFDNTSVNHSFCLILKLVLISIVILLYFLFSENKSRYLNFFRVIFPFLILAYLYKETDQLNNIFISHNLDNLISHWESSLFGVQPSLAFSEIFPYNWFAEIMYFGYFAYYLLVVAIPLFTYAKIDAELGQRLVFTVIFSFLLFYCWFIIFPVAGPQFYFNDGYTTVPKGYVFGAIMRLIQLHGEGETGAFPSSHVSICLMVLWMSYKYIARWFPYVLVISFLLILSTVYLKAHYVVDVLAAIIVTTGMYIIATRTNHILTNLSKHERNLSY